MGGYVSRPTYPEYSPQEMQPYRPQFQQETIPQRGMLEQMPMRLPEPQNYQEKSYQQGQRMDTMPYDN